MASLEGFLDELIAVVRQASGIRYAPDDPPSQIAASPAAVVWLASGRNIMAPPGVSTSHYGVRVALLTSMDNIATANQVILPRIETVVEAIWRGLTAGRLSNCQNIGQILLSYGPVEWGGVWLFGATIDLEDVKIQRTV